MTSLIRAAVVGVAIAATGASAAFAGKTTTPNTTAPSSIFSVSQIVNAKTLQYMQDSSAQQIFQQSVANSAGVDVDSVFILKVIQNLE